MRVFVYIYIYMYIYISAIGMHVTMNSLCGQDDTVAYRY